MKEKYITPEQAATLLKASKATVYNYINDGLLIKYRIRKKLVLYRKEVEGLLIARAEE